MGIRFEICQRCSHTLARLGKITTMHGVADTPLFMPVGTQGSVKTVGSEDLEALGFQFVLSNTYHLELRPGSERIKAAGGLQKFMSWSGSILTDSGGYQVMSLSAMRTITDEGVSFRSHLDGSQMHLTPERAIQIQADLNSDISMALDVCPSYPCSRDEAAKAMEQTHRWAHRNLNARRADQSVFGIVQGGVHEDLRRESAEFTSSLPFDGFAIGGVSVGEPTELQYPVVQFTTPMLPDAKPRYLMGVGHPKDILHAVSKGVDMFDCVLPTRLARHHSLYTLQGRKNIAAARFASDDGPIDPESDFSATSRYSAAYVRHLFQAKEPLGARIATMHNLAFYARLMQEIRDAIRSGTWPDLISRYEDT